MNWRRYLLQLLDATANDMDAVRGFNADVEMLNSEKPLFCETHMKFIPQHEPEVLER